MLCSMLIRSKHDTTWEGVCSFTKIRRAGLDSVDEVDTVDLSLCPSWDQRLDFRQSWTKPSFTNTTIVKGIREKMRVIEIIPLKLIRLKVP